MKILMVCSEFAGLAKTGGLADATAGLSGALAARGHDVRVLLPKYSHLPPPVVAVEAFTDASGRFRFLTWGTSSGPRFYLLDLRSSTENVIYAGDERDALRFLELSAAVPPLCAAVDWHPDVFHCHDWQTALVPALPGARVVAPAVLTLHNLGHQGAYGADVLAGNPFADLTRFVDARARRKRAINFLRIGIGAAAAITTVSRRYAKEICSPEQGMGLERVLEARAADLTGIVNGVDYSVWSPDCDAFIEHRFDASNLEPKHRLKRSLCERLKLAADGAPPLIGVVSRLDPQKGIDLLVRALPSLLRATQANFVIHGAGRPKIAAKLGALARKCGPRVSFIEGYDEATAHEIVAASDVALLPSRYEPCGLIQLYALRYGTIPVARATGGFLDTIEPVDAPEGSGTGFLFEKANARHLKRAVLHALDVFGNRGLWARIVANAMRANYSWEKPVERYEAVYRTARESWP